MYGNSVPPTRWESWTMPRGTSDAYGRPRFSRVNASSKLTFDLINASAAVAASCGVRASQNRLNPASMAGGAAISDSDIAATQAQARAILALYSFKRHHRVVVRLHRVRIDCRTREQYIALGPVHLEISGANRRRPQVSFVAAGRRLQPRALPCPQS